MFNLANFKEAPFEERVDLEITFIPSQDDGYGSWNRARERHVVGKNLDDPELSIKVREKVTEILGQKDVTDGSQKPLFDLRAVKEKSTRLTEIRGLLLG